jgi:hypothetical protein
MSGRVSKITLHSTVLYSTTLCCTVLYSTTLCCTVLYSTTLYCTVQYYTMLHCTVQYYTVLYCIMLHCTVQYYTVLYCTVWLPFSHLRHRRILTALIAEMGSPSHNRYISSSSPLLTCSPLLLPSTLFSFVTWRASWTLRAVFLWLCASPSCPLCWRDGL